MMTTTKRRACEGSCDHTFYIDQLTPWELSRHTSPAGVEWVDERLLCDDCYPKCDCGEPVWPHGERELCEMLKERNDAILMEAHYKQRAEKAEAELAARDEQIAKLMKAFPDRGRIMCMGCGWKTDADSSDYPAAKEQMLEHKKNCIECLQVPYPDKIALIRKTFERNKELEAELSTLKARHAESEEQV